MKRVKHIISKMVILSLMSMCLSDISYSQSVSARGNSGNTDFSRVEEKLKTLQIQLNSATEALAALNTCNQQGKFYRPSNATADSNGCVVEEDPQVGSLSNGLSCTSDGQRVNCGYDLTSELSGMRSNIDAVKADLADLRQNVLPGLESRLQTAFRAELAALDKSLQKLISDSIAQLLNNITSIYSQLDTIDKLLSTNRSQLGDAFGQIKGANDRVREILDKLNALANGNALPVCFGKGKSLQWDGSKWSCRTSFCALPWGGTIGDEETVTAYAWNGACFTPNRGSGVYNPSEVRVCSNGVLSGSYVYQSCIAAARSERAGGVGAGGAGGGAR